MRIAIIHFSPAASENETALAVARAGMEPVEYLLNDLKAELASCAGYVIVGQAMQSSVAEVLPSTFISTLKLQSDSGKPVLGIGSGAQFLTEFGLVPGIAGHGVGIRITASSTQSVPAASAYMRLTDDYQYNAYTRQLAPRTILPVLLDGIYGCFSIPPGLLAEMRVQGLNLFQYCDAQGKISTDFPVNPYDSIDNIAAVSNKMGNVLAMVPHIERTIDGDVIFASMRAYIEKGHVESVAPLHYFPR